MKRLKKLDNILFLMLLFGIIPIILAAFDIYRQQYQEYKFVFLFSLWIGVIGTTVLKRYKMKKLEQQMKKGAHELPID